MTEFSQVHRIFDTYMLDRLVPSSNPNLMEAVEELGCPTQLLSYAPDLPQTARPVDCPLDSWAVAVNRALSESAWKEYIGKD